MSKLITIGNIAFFQYPPTKEKATFDLDSYGVLFIAGVKEKLFPLTPAINSMKRFELKLEGYIVVGEVKDILDKLEGRVQDIIEANNINTDNCVLLRQEFNYG